MAVTRRKSAAKKTRPKAPVATSAADASGVAAAQSPQSPRSPRDPSYVVGVGASAGGLEAFEKFFDQMPPNTGMAFVLVPHLDPTHKSIMSDLLGRYTRMTIPQVTYGMKVQPNTIYIIPPNKELSIKNGTLELLEPKEIRGLRHPIDTFFRALAEDQRDRAICIVLSGTGTEGTLGLRAVKGEGGLVIVQDPKTAKYDGMPTSAIATGVVDYILPPEKMPAQLLEYMRHDRARPVPLPKQLESSPAENIQKILATVRLQTGHDFSLYKQNTVLRRIERRMAIHEIETIAGYAAHLRNNPAEVEELFKELLIRVTNFFREPEAFKVLQQKVIPALLKGRPESVPVRVWVPGCSTGEEAYSLAILFLEHLHKHRIKHKIQVFATDIDAGAIETARNGIYPESITVDVSAERLGRYFVKKGNTFKVKEEVREIVIFAVQSIIKDPPFSKIDLASCRNLLIYLGPELQRRVLPLFHYALNPEGYLFLGSSESVGEGSKLFAVVDKKWKIFRSKKLEKAPVLPPEMRVPIPIERGLHPEAPLETRKLGEPSIGEATSKLLVEFYSPACVLVNDRGDILYLHGRTGKYLEPAPGKASMNLLDMAREGLRLELRTALRKVIAKKADHFVEGIEVKTNGTFHTMNLGLKYIKQPAYLAGLILAAFFDVPPPKRGKGERRKMVSSQKVNDRMRELEFEIKATREHLQTVIEEQETSNEELKSMNEELQSSNEELQSTNEELETSKEELQSVNEELVTVNSELQNKIDELSQINNDMANLLASTEIATVFLDSQLRIKRFTPAMIDVFNLIEGDVGRPISDIVAKIDYPDLAKDAEEVIRNLSNVEKLVKTPGGRWYLTRIIPYRTSANVIDGVVLTFINVTEQRTAQEALRETTFSQAVVETMPQPMLVLDGEKRVVFANKAFFGTFASTADETLQRNFFSLHEGTWEIPELRQELAKALAEDHVVERFAVERVFPRIGRRKLLVNARRMTYGREPSDAILLSLEDVTAR